MIPRWFLLVNILLLTGILPLQTFCEAKKDGPKITETKLDFRPVDLFYFANSDTLLYQNDLTYNVQVSFDGGASWQEIKDDDGLMKDSVVSIWPHPHDNQKAYILGRHGRHWITTDQAKSWRPFKVDAVPSIAVMRTLAFHGTDSHKVIFHGDQCLGFSCLRVAFYTVDDFKTVQPMRTHSRGCWWALSNPEFAEGPNGDDIRNKINNRILCIVPGLKNPFFNFANRLVYSDNFFGDDEEGIEVGLSSGGRPVSGIIDLAAVKRHVVAAARSEGTDELALYITDDAIIWHRAEFGNQKIEQDGFTVLESTNYSIQIDVQNTGRLGTMGVLFTSNSNGTYFTRNIEHTNRDIEGRVDFEKIANIQGIVLVNVVDNWKAVEDELGVKKNVVSKISFDDGHTFQSLKVGDKNLHLHSVTAFENVGRVFSSPAPGLVMGVGNTGDHLKDYKDGDLYVSDDAGVKWRKGLDKPHKYEFGDQGGVIMAISDDKEAAGKIQFSIDHGKEWETEDLPDKIKPLLLTTNLGSTNLKFLLMGQQADKADSFIVYSIDFSNMHERECGDDDFEKWPARLDDKGEPDCLMGHKQYYRRRKSDAECFVSEGYNVPTPIFEQCVCTREDFECDYNFKQSEDGTECTATSAFKPSPDKCKNPDDTYKGPSGWRLIPGNACIRDGGVNLDEGKEQSCKDAQVPSSENIQIKKTTFGSSQFTFYTYLERKETSSGDDETIVMLTDDGTLHLTHDHGKTWDNPLDTRIEKIIQHDYLNDRAYFLTSGTEAYVTINRGETITNFKAPTSGWEYVNIAFHESKKDWLIWTGPSDNCVGDTCGKDAHISKNRGTDFETLLGSVEKCLFMASESRKDSETLIFCDQHADEIPTKHRQLLSTTNWFDDSTVHIKNVEQFASQAEFIIAAARNPEKMESLKAETSIDGQGFADAEFPPGFDVPVQVAYTVLDSSTHSIFLHVTVNKDPERAYGTIIKSNSNGTSYVRSVDGVSRDRNGFVDFEKMEGLEGIALVNVVANIAEVDNGKDKLLKTKITHNDGARWSYIPPPAKDADGRPYNCLPPEGKATERCSLHLHGYTERIDPRATYSSASAIGLMFGVGNVGEFLMGKDEADTFFTRDGGISWKSVKKGNYRWEYGDQGSILVLVEADKPTNVISYSVDEGETWVDFEFSDEKMRVLALSTVPSDTSKNFLIWGMEESSRQWATVNLDFSNLRDRTCKLDETTGDGQDYYLWQPRHPLQEDNCLFGHVEQYHRKNPKAHCWNNWFEVHVHLVAHNCSCTRQDYEWYVNTI